MSKGNDMTAKTAKVKLRDSYLELIYEFPLVRIKSDRELKNAQKVINALLAKGKLDDGQEDYLDVLSDLVEAYEDEHFPIGPASDAAILAHLMDAKGVSQTALHDATGIAKSTISDILAGRRPFSKNVMLKLAEFFGVHVSVFMENLK